MPFTCLFCLKSGVARCELWTVTFVLGASVRSRCDTEEVYLEGPGGCEKKRQGRAALRGWGCEKKRPGGGGTWRGPWGVRKAKRT